MLAESWTVPAHVPAALVRDLDLYALPGYRTDPRGALQAIHHENPPIFFTPRHGGMWVFNRSNLILDGLNDHRIFSSDGAVFIPAPPEGIRIPPDDVDPPLHSAYRHPINMSLAPKSVQRLAKLARDLAKQLIGGFKNRGRCEFVGEFARQLPVKVFLDLVELPSSDHNRLVQLGARLNHPTNLEERQKAFFEIYGYIEPYVRARYEKPGDDLISKICQIKLGDRRITLKEARDESGLLLIGGLDTVASTMTWIAKCLAENPELRAQLVADITLIPNAVEEFLRVTAIVSLGRMATADVEIEGASIKRGDRVLMMCSLAGLDEQQWKDPLAIDFKRDARNHAAFGNGIHRCPGANLARAELQIFLEEWLKEIPSFSIEPESDIIAESGSVQTISALPLVWTVID